MTGMEEPRLAGGIVTVGPEMPGEEAAISAVHAEAFSDGGKRSSEGEVRLVE